ncbi:MAG TPA: hypothetical protein VF017_11320 [Thermoanaerobaculia bacterium]|nr:hypothetical protein [Thermoanaerobaculia bacterium]
MSDPTLRRKLTVLAEGFAREILVAIDDGKLLQDEVPYRVFEADYSEGMVQGNWMRELRNEWDLSTVHRLFDQYIGRHAAPFEECASEMRPDGIDLPGARGHLTNLMIRVALDAAQSQTLSSPETLVERFLGELSGGPVEWWIQAWLTGIKVVGEDLEVGDGLVLRRLCAADFRWEELDFLSPLGFDQLMMSGVESVLETRGNAEPNGRGAEDREQPVPLRLRASFDRPEEDLV